MPTAQIVVRDGAAAEESFTASESADLIPGKNVEIAIGYDGKDRSIFKGLIVKHAIKIGANGDSILTLSCKEAATKLTVLRHSRYFTDSS